MSTINEDVSAIKTIQDGLVNNKVARFSYTQKAYIDNIVDGVDTYNVNNEQNIPNGTADIMKVNDTIINKGYRAQASSITRMLMNHFLGRISYNLNKVNDNMLSLLQSITTNLGNVVNTGDSATPVSGGTTKFTTGGAYTELNKKNDKITVSEDYSTTLTDDHAFTSIPKGANPTVGKNRTLSQVWDYIKSKANSVYAKLSHTHTKSQITDFPTSLPANGGTADKAVEVVDYGNTLGTVKVGYNGPSVPKDNLLYLAGYTERTINSVKIKDVAKEDVKKWLDIESAPYINTLDIAISSEVSVTMNTFTSNAINAPVAIDGLVITHHLSSTRATQLALCGAQLFTRTYSNSTWSAWNAMWNTQES